MPDAFPDFLLQDLLIYDQHTEEYIKFVPGNVR